MIDAVLQGRLLTDPERRTSKNGKPYVLARVAVSDREGTDHAALLTSFDDDAVTALLALGKGDAAAVAGELAVSVWTAEGREPRPALRVLVHRVLTPYHVQRRRAAADRREPGR